MVQEFQEMNILIVDDSKANCLLLHKYLETDGYRSVHYVLSAIEALERLHEGWDLILMDIMMPHMDGIEAVAEVRKQIGQQQLPIIMVTAAGQIEYLKNAFAAGANDYVAKPVSRIEFLARIEATLALKHQYDEKVRYEQILENLLEEQRVQVTAMESAANGIVITDEQYNVEWANRASEGIFGWSKRELFDTNVLEILDEKTRRKIYEYVETKRAMKDVMECSDGLKSMISFQRKDNQHRMGQLTCTYITVKRKNALTQKLIFIIEDVTDEYKTRAKLEKELELAKQIQKNLLSPNIFDNQLQIVGQVQVSNRLSGDFYYWSKLSDHEYGVIIVDVMGHGVSSSMISMNIRSLLPGIVNQTRDPVLVIQQLNKHMNTLYYKKEDTAAEMDYFFTSIYLFINLQENQIRYVNGGHPFGYLFKKDQKMDVLDVGCPPIGMFQDIDIEEGKIPFEIGDRIVLYSDGLFELLPQEHELQENYIIEQANDCKDGTAAELLQQLLSISEHDQGEQSGMIEDDITVIVIERK